MLLYDPACAGKNCPPAPKGRKMLRRNIDLMDEATFPRESIYLAKDNPNSNSIQILREEKSDEEIIIAVTADMSNSLGEDLEP